MSLHLDPSSFINANQVATLAFNLISIANAVILGYSLPPAVQYSSLPNLHILEDLALAPGTPYYYHFNPRVFTEVTTSRGIHPPGHSKRRNTKHQMRASEQHACSQSLHKARSNRGCQIPDLAPRLIFRHCEARSAMAMSGEVTNQLSDCFARLAMTCWEDIFS